MAKQEKTIYLLTLGCPKNEVDSDCIASSLREDGWHMAACPEEAEVIAVNTCSFIVPAVEESIEAILELSDLGKRDGKSLVVMGCLVSRYGAESLTPLLSEVDLFVNFEDYPRIPALMLGLLGDAGEVPCRDTTRVFASSLEKGYVYLKIAEGCGRNCAYCTIPGIRGPLRSRPLGDIREEARFFVERGAGEIVLVAQDTTSYGLDLYGRASLPVLLEELCGLGGGMRIRVMYMHPEGVDESLLAVMGHARVCSYLDLSLQHIDPGVLSAMGRRGCAESFGRLIERIRGSLEGVALRATFMLGFPGEDDEAFSSLRDFVAATRFDWLGLFGYSQEEGTPAFCLGKGVPDAVVHDRVADIAALQEEIMRGKALGMVGRRLSVLLEGESAEVPGFWEARSCREAPEIDGVVFVPDRQGLRAGDFREVTVTASEGIDLIGVVQG